MEQSTTRSNKAGIIIILTILAVAIAGGLFGVWWHASSMSRAMQFWGNENAQLIRLAPQVEFGEIEGPLSLSTTIDSKLGTVKTENGTVIDPPLIEVELPPDGKKLTLSKHHEFSSEKGLLHIRDAILNDKVYGWDQTAPSFQPSHILIFREGNKTFTIWIDFANETVSSTQSAAPNQRVVAKKLVDYIKDFIKRVDPNLITKAKDK